MSRDVGVIPAANTARYRRDHRITVVVETWNRSAVPRIVDPDSTWNRASFNRPSSDNGALAWAMKASFVNVIAWSLHTSQGGLPHVNS
jgi:hypothetical protein